MADYSRRTINTWMLLGGAAALVGCDGELSGDTETPDDTGSTPNDTGITVGGWATGGTAAMVAKSTYSDPFSTPSDCDLTCETTEGPCTSTSAEREDISEGFTGLPVRLLLRIVDSSCTPIEGAQVLIWHTQRTGVYSGVTPSGSFCYGDDPGAEEYLYFRGHQTTDASGVAAFDTCFPGWYASRAPHIHIQVTVDDTLFLTTQVVFDDAICTAIYGNHEEYVEFGLPDTTLATDTVVGGAEDPATYALEYEQEEDGAMLAWKTIVVRSSTSEAVCAAEGAAGGGPGGPGGPP